MNDDLYANGILTVGAFRQAGDVRLTEQVPGTRSRDALHRARLDNAEPNYPVVGECGTTAP